MVSWDFLYLAKWRHLVLLRSLAGSWGPWDQAVLQSALHCGELVTAFCVILLKAVFKWKTENSGDNVLADGHDCDNNERTSDKSMTIISQLKKRKTMQQADGIAILESESTHQSPLTTAPWCPLPLCLKPVWW